MPSFHKKYIDLRTENNRKLFYNSEKIKIKCLEIQSFLNQIKFINTLDFTKGVLFPYEIKFNNTIEGYNEDINNIINIINFPHDKTLKTKEDYQRIRNMYLAYTYILNKKTFDKDTLYKLYSILSANLLEEDDIINKAQYYRDRDVYIFFSDRLDIEPDKETGTSSNEPDKGIGVSLIEPYMKDLLEYINDSSDIDVTTDAFIKSQIAHYYFVYIHPYYDINGRTARTLSLWHLIKNQAYPFTIFNRAIPNSTATYCRIIREVKKYSNITYFLTYMLENVHHEIEKEYIINEINTNLDNVLNPLEKQTLQYILENKVNTALDFATFYNRFNNRKKAKKVFEEMLLPLVEKKVLILGRENNKIMFDNQNNVFYTLNQELTKESQEKVKTLKKQRTF
jgi:Fic family protein